MIKTSCAARLAPISSTPIACGGHLYVLVARTLWSSLRRKIFLHFYYLDLARTCETIGLTAQNNNYFRRKLVASDKTTQSRLPSFRRMGIFDTRQIVKVGSRENSYRVYVRALGHGSKRFGIFRTFADIDVFVRPTWIPILHKTIRV